MRATHRLAKGIAGLCMIVGPLALLVAATVHPRLERDTAAEVAVAREHVDAWIVGHASHLVALVLLIGATIALAYLLREREPLLALAGCALGVVGLATNVGYIAIHGFVEWQAVSAGDPAEMTALVERIFDSPAVLVPFLLLPGFTVGGMVLLAVALRRSRAAPAWVAVALGLGPAVLGLGSAAYLASNALYIAGAALLVAALGWLGWHVLRWSDVYAPALQAARNSSASAGSW